MLIGRFETGARHIDWTDEQTDQLSELFFNLRSVLDRMDEGKPVVIGPVDANGFDILVGEAAAVLPFSKRAQLERAGGGIGMKNDAMSNVTPLRSTVSKLRRRGCKPVGVIVADIWREDLGPCAVCTMEGGSCRGPVQGHHVIAKQKLKQLGHSDLLLDKRNRLAVCERRHEQHTTGYRPIPRACLPDSVFEFAAELNLGWYLDRYYGPAGDAA